MFNKFSLTALAFAASTQAAISILYPHSQAIWYKNNTVQMNWTLTNPQTDTYLFRTYLSNSDQSILSGNHSIADSTSASAQDVRILLPQIPAGEGYIVNLVNTTNESQVFATSDPFEIADGTVTTSTTSGTSTSSSTSGSSNLSDIPNAKTTSSQNPFPTSASTPSTSSSSTSSAKSTFDNGLNALVIQGMSVVLISTGALVAL